MLEIGVSIFGQPMRALSEFDSIPFDSISSFRQFGANDDNRFSSKFGEERIYELEAKDLQWKFELL